MEVLAGIFLSCGASPDVSVFEDGARTALYAPTRQEASPAQARLSALRNEGKPPRVISSRKRAQVTSCIFIICLFIFSLAAPAQDAPREYQIKAAFLYNFAQFTEWPKDAFAGTNDPIVIGVLGTNPFGTFLDQTVKGEIIRGRPLIIEHYKSVEEIKTCHILYIGHSEWRRLEQVVRRLKGKPILTVSDSPNAADEGVDIGFVTEHNRIKLQINLEAIKSTALVVSSKLLRLAQIVKPT